MSLVLQFGNTEVCGGPGAESDPSLHAVTVTQHLQSLPRKLAWSFPENHLILSAFYEPCCGFLLQRMFAICDTNRKQLKAINQT